MQSYYLNYLHQPILDIDNSIHSSAVRYYPTHYRPILIDIKMDLSTFSVTLTGTKDSDITINISINSKLFQCISYTHLATKDIDDFYLLHDTLLDRHLLNLI